MANQDMGRFSSISNERRAVTAAALVAASALSALSSAVSAQATQPGAMPTGSAMLADGKLMINFRDASLDQIIDEVGRAGGFSVVKIAKVEGGVVSMTSAPDGDSKDQTVELLDAAAGPLGYRVIREGDTLKVSRIEPVRRGAGRLVPISRSLTPEQAMILTGIVQGDGKFEAFLENIVTAKISRVAIGDSVANGQIADIQIDRIAYVSGGKMIWVLAGSNLTGDSLPRKESRP
jgi:hypothetical protein